VEDSLKELNLAITLRMAWEAGFKDFTWVRRDPDLAMLRDEPEFDRLCPATEDSGTHSGARSPPPN
jgi:hypothetical protein